MGTNQARFSSSRYGIDAQTSTRPVTGWFSMVFMGQDEIGGQALVPVVKSEFDAVVKHGGAGMVLVKTDPDGKILKVL